MSTPVNTSFSNLHNLTSILSVTSNRTNGTSSFPPAVDDCNTAALTAGSAAFIIIALMLGCMTQPAGSLVTHTGNRFWRISPFLNILEIILVAFWLTSPCINELLTFIRRRLPRDQKFHLPTEERVGDMSLKVAAYTALVQRLGNSRSYDLWARQQNDDQEITVEQIVELTREVQNMERGATLRPAIILPMVLQFLKVMFIQTTSGFAWKIWPLIYFFSWLSIEVLLLIIHGAPLSDTELRQVELEIITSLAVTEVQGNNRTTKNMTPLDSSSSTSPPISTADSSVLEQSMRLLQGSQNSVPRHRIYFRGRRRSLKTIQGNPSAGFLLITLGRIAICVESYAHMLPILIWIDLPSGWSIFLYMFLSLAPHVLFDILFGFAVMCVEAFFSKPEQIAGLAPQVGMRDFVVLKTAIVWMVYFLYVYSSDGMLKPAWLDWLG